METKVKNNKIQKKIIGIISIFALSDVLVMVVPFYLKNVMSSLVIANSLGIEPSQFSQANSIYGYVALLSYFFGGYFADKINLKKLTFTGLVLVGLLGIWYSLIPFISTGKVAQVYVIFACWSFVTCFIFWSALWKLLAQQGTPEQNGTLNGIHGSLNGIIGTVLIAIAYLVFYLMNDVWQKALGAWAFSGLVYVFTVFIIIDAFLILFFVPNPDKIMKESSKEDKFDLRSLKLVLKNYKIWLVAILIMGVYMFQTGLSVFVTFIQDALMVLPVIVVVLGILRTYLFRAIFSKMAGNMADKTQKYILFLTIGLFISAVLCLAAFMITGFTETSFVNMSKTVKVVIQVMVSILYLLIGIVCWTLVTNRWATIYEINVDHKQYATAIGFISFIAFSPDAWFWQIDSVMLKKYGIEAGYSNNKVANEISLSIITAIGMVGFLAGIILLVCLKREKAHSHMRQLK